MAETRQDKMIEGKLLGCNIFRNGFPSFHRSNPQKQDTYIPTNPLLSSNLGLRKTSPMHHFLDRSNVCNS
jgi:hypothetical protein